MHLVVTISGNPSGTKQTPPARADANSTGSHLLTERPTPALENLDSAAPIASDHDSDLEAADVAIVKSLKEVGQVKPNLVQRSDGLPGDQAGVVTTVADGFASILSNLNGIMNLANLLADVSNILFLSDSK